MTNSPGQEDCSPPDNSCLKFITVIMFPEAAIWPAEFPMETDRNFRRAQDLVCFAKPSPKLAPEGACYDPAWNLEVSGGTAGKQLSQRLQCVSCCPCPPSLSTVSFSHVWEDGGWYPQPSPSMNSFGGGRSIYKDNSDCPGLGLSYKTTRRNFESQEGPGSIRWG